jgi:DNA-binding NarL/FixJ family response regulator
MKKIKIILASRPKMVSDVIKNMIKHQPDMEVVGEVIDPIELLRFSSKLMVDVVIVSPLKSNGEPKICSHLLAEHPPLKVITLSEKGESAYLYQSDSPRLCIEKPTGQLIVKAIRNAIK